ncbi:MAG: acetyl-CoA carboxylase biotin carboxylase subunit [Roseiflexaceae bacterium]
MFNKLLIANRGAVAVRIIQTCRELGLPSVAVYDPSDQGALHMRLADECVPIAPGGYANAEEILRAAQLSGAQAVHPGYGFLAERAGFAHACADAGLVFVGPPAGVLATLTDKILALDRAAAAGFSVPHHSPIPFGPGNLDQLAGEAQRLGYPLILKSCQGGRGRGTRVVRSPERLLDAAQRAMAESLAVFGTGQIYLEHALMPARYVEVTVLGDGHGHLIHLNEHDGSLLRGNQKAIEESPAPYLDAGTRAMVCRRAVEIARLFGCRNACAVEFVLDLHGNSYFTEIKARLQVEHALCEALTGVDLVREQIRIAAGEPLGLTQAEVRAQGWALLCRINAEDPLNHALPSPGRLRRFRLPDGPGVRADTHLYADSDVPVSYDPLLATLVVQGPNRAACLARARRALGDFLVDGVMTNIAVLQQLLDQPEVQSGDYTTTLARRPLPTARASEADLRDLAVAAALAYELRTRALRPSTPARTNTGWHRSSRNQR